MLVSDKYISEFILSNRSSMRVLRVLVGVSVALSVRQIALQANITYPAANDALDRLVRVGMVIVSKSGNARLYQLVRKNIYIENVISPLFWLEDNFRDEIVAELRQKLSLPVVSVVLFGSFAREEQTSESDVDILIVTSDTGQKSVVERLLLGYSLEFYDRFGHRLEALVYDYKQANELYKRAPALYAEIEEDGQVIFGTDDWMDHE